MRKQYQTRDADASMPSTPSVFGLAVAEQVALAEIAQSATEGLLELP